MWETAAICVAVGLVGFAIVQAGIVAAYLRTMKPVKRPADFAESDSCAVLMAVRGADKNLPHTISAVLNQQGVRFHLHLIVDSMEDPAVALIERLQHDYPNRSTLHCMKIETDTCSLKCLGLAQTVRLLQSSHSPPKYYAFVDSDGEVSRDWLLRLLAPLRAATLDRVARSRPVGATTGHRWYTCFSFQKQSDQGGRPQLSNNLAAGSYSLGAIIRYFWNLGSLPQMALYQIVWGGSWAISADWLVHSQLLESWERALFEDTQVAEFVHRAGARTVVAPGVLVRSYEAASISEAGHWIGRQLLDLRLYHRCFPLVLAHALVLAGLHVGTIGLIFALAILGSWWALALVLGAALLFQLVYFLIWGAIQWRAEQCLQNLDFSVPSQQEPAPKDLGSRTSTLGSLAAVWGLIWTQISYPWAALRTIFIRTIIWRGIEYRIDSPYNIRRLNYQVCSMGGKYDSATEQH